MEVNQHQQVIQIGVKGAQVDRNVTALATDSKIWVAAERIGSMNRLFQLNVKADT